MADIELIVKISEVTYKKLKWLCESDIGIDSPIDRTIANGIPLPKGHGRLIDANSLRSMYSINRANFNTVVGIQKWIDDAPTIIEADKGDKE